MKKLFSLLFISIFIISNIFAKSAQVELITNIPDTEITYQLYYNDELLAENEQKVISVNPLTEDGETLDFTILATYNKRKGDTLSVTITPTSFKATVGSSVYDSEITPNVIYDSSNKTKLDSGRHVDKKIFGFHFEWEGDENLPAGNYASDIAINYTIE